MASIKQQGKPSIKYPDTKETLPISNSPNTKLFPDDKELSQTNSLDNSTVLDSEIMASDQEEKFEACDNPILVCKKFIQDRFPQLRSGRERTRMYHVWPGKNVFFLSGRLVCGPDPRGFILTMVSIVLSSWIFCIYVGSDLRKHSGLIVSLALVLTVLVLVNLILVSAVDPGIIPRNNIPGEGFAASEGLSSMRVRIGGAEVRLKFCRVCKIFRPPRSCHCAICDNCVEKFDHHCPWIGQCIGLRNYRFYLLFVLSSLVFFIYVFYFSCRRINQKMAETRARVFTTAGNCPETFALASFSFVAMWFLGGLTSFHTYLIMLNQTAYENYKQCQVDSPNPYDKGILRNLKEVMCSGLPPSNVNFREEMALNMNGPELDNKSCYLNRVNAMKGVEAKGDKTVELSSRKIYSEYSPEVNLQKKRRIEGDV